MGTILFVSSGESDGPIIAKKYIFKKRKFLKYTI